MTPSSPDRDEIARALAVLYEPGDVVELRVPKTRKGTITGYFTNWEALIAENKVKQYARHTTGDTDILVRRWMLFDFDVIQPVRRVLGRVTDPVRNGGGWLARCPSHQDRVRSLSGGQGRDGRCLIHSFAGCDVCVVVDALGRMADLFIASRERRRWHG